MKKIINILALLLVTNHFVLGQNSRTVTPISLINTIEEAVYLHCNTTTFLSGETLLFKVYALNPTKKTFSPTSKIGYVELLDDSNKSVMKQKIVLKNGTGQGDFFITTTLKTGNYKLITYTNWTLNKATNGIHKTDIFIINPFENNILKENTGKVATEKGVSDTFHTTQKANELKANNSLIFVKTDKPKYATREKINLTLLSDLKNESVASLSVSVRKADSLPISRPTTSIEFLNTVATQSNSNTEKSNFLPELRGEIISGRITANDNSKSLKDKTVSLSIPGKYFGIKMVKTDESGKFHFILDEHPGTANAIIQIVEKDRNDYAIALDGTSTPDFGSLPLSRQLYLNAKNKNDIENRSIANQIENNYYQKKKDSLLTAPKTIPFFHPLEKEYILDDYTRFPALKETIVEVLPDVYYTKDKETYSIHVRDNSVGGETFGESLIMVDGLLIQDVNELFEYDTQNIYKVSVINQGYVYGPKVFNGIINFVTKKNDYETKTTGDFIKAVAIDRPQTQKKHFSPNHSEKESNRIPDYRYQLLWQPEIVLKGKETPVSFFASDVKGQFQITIEGFTDKGDAISIKEYITVE